MNVGEWECRLPVILSLPPSLPLSLYVKLRRPIRSPDTFGSPMWPVIEFRAPRRYGTAWTASRLVPSSKLISLCNCNNNPLSFLFTIFFDWNDVFSKETEQIEKFIQFASIYRILLICLILEVDIRLGESGRKR